MGTRSWRRSGRWRENIKTHCSPLSVRRSAMPLQFSCSRLPISRALFEGCTRDINNWEVPSRAMGVPRDKCEGAEDEVAHSRGGVFSEKGATSRTVSRRAEPLNDMEETHGGRLPWLWQKACQP